MDRYQQVGRLLELAEVVELHPDNFDMDNWACILVVDSHGDEYMKEVSSVDEILTAFKKKEPVSCGTTACLAGWAVALWSKEAKEIGGNIESAAQEILGYKDNCRDLDSLFASSAPWQTGEEAATELRRRAAVLLAEDLCPDSKTYTLTVTVRARSNDDYPEARQLAGGIAEGLHEAWFDIDEGDAFEITNIHS